MDFYIVLFSLTNNLFFLHIFIFFPPLCILSIYRMKDILLSLLDVTISGPLYILLSVHKETLCMVMI